MPHRDDAQDHADRAALLEDVAAEAAEARHAVGEVDLLALLELLALLGRHDRARAIATVSLVVEPLLLGRDDERAVDPHHRVAADLEVQVGRAAGDGDLQQIVDVHGDGTPNSGLSAGDRSPQRSRRLRRRSGAARPGYTYFSQPWRVGRLAVDDRRRTLAGSPR